MRPSQTAIQRRGRSDIDKGKADNDWKLALTDVGLISGVAVGGLGLLIVLSFWLAVGRIPFIVGAAVPLLTLLAVIYQAVVYRRQWNAMERALKQTDSVIAQMQHQLIASNNATEVAKQQLFESKKQTANSEASLIIAQRGIEHAQRAYVSIVGREFFGDGFNLVVENSGNTPALEVHINAVVDVGMSAPKTEGGEGIVHIGLLAPRASYRHAVSLGKELSAAEREEFHNEFTGEYYYWWVTGYIFYRDIFQDDPSNYHVTEFSFYRGEKTNGVRADSSGNGVKEYRNDQEVKRSPN